MASNGPPPKSEMSKATSPPPPIKRPFAIAARERAAVRMDAGNIVATGLLGFVLGCSLGSNLGDGE
jgi:hypothetical protein